MQKHPEGNAKINQGHRSSRLVSAWFHPKRFTSNHSQSCAHITGLSVKLEKPVGLMRATSTNSLTSFCIVFLSRTESNTIFCSVRMNWWSTHHTVRLMFTFEPRAFKNLTLLTGRGVLESKLGKCFKSRRTSLKCEALPFVCTVLIRSGLQRLPHTGGSRSSNASAAPCHTYPNIFPVSMRTSLTKDEIQFNRKMLRATYSIKESLTVNKSRKTLLKVSPRAISGSPKNLHEPFLI